MDSPLPTLECENAALSFLFDICDFPEQIQEFLRMAMVPACSRLVASGVHVVSNTHMSGSNNQMDVSSTHMGVSNNQTGVSDTHMGVSNTRCGVSWNRFRSFSV